MIAADPFSVIEFLTAVFDMFSSYFGFKLIKFMKSGS
jgi:hypothetical protein